MHFWPALRRLALVAFVLTFAASPSGCLGCGGEPAPADGYEEWLHLDEGLPGGERAVAAWSIKGATPRQAGEAVEIDDAGGAARLRVTAPSAYGASGRPIAARLVVRDATIELWAD